MTPITRADLEALGYSVPPGGGVATLEPVVF